MTAADDRVLALAGVAQAAKIVDQVAKTGTWPEAFLEASVQSLFTFDAPSVEAVYGHKQALKLGLDQLASCLVSRQSSDQATIARYLMALLHLEAKFAQRADLQDILHHRLQHAAFKKEHFSNEINALFANISAIYQDTLSTLRFRIKVTGSVQHLEKERNADIVRTVLLTGVRSAHLWRQLGGRRWHLLFQRGSIVQQALKLSREITIR